MSMKLGNAGLRLIKSFEGCRLTAYKPVPSEPHWTIGWGHCGPDIRKGQTITQSEADTMLANDLQKYVNAVNALGLNLNQNQFDALVSFCYNCGTSNLKTLCKGRTNAQISDAILLYNKAGGKVLNGLVRRRTAEQKLFNTPVKNIIKKEVVKVAKAKTSVKIMTGGLTPSMQKEMEAWLKEKCWSYKIIQ